MKIKKLPMQIAFMLLALQGTVANATLSCDDQWHKCNNGVKNPAEAQACQVTYLKCKGGMPATPATPVIKK